MNLNLTKLASAIDECNKHIKRISSAYTELNKIMPLTEEAFRNLNDYDVRLLDQFIFRFSKLQDDMGQRLFPALLPSLEEDVKAMAFIDILNRIEKLGLLTSKNERLLLKKLRNDFSHEYSNDIRDNVETVNNLLGKAHFMYDTFAVIKNYSIDKFADLKGDIEIFYTPPFPEK
jgi:hypothetical protein